MRIPPRKNCKKHLKSMNESNTREVEKNTKNDHCQTQGQSTIGKALKIQKFQNLIRTPIRKLAFYKIERNLRMKVHEAKPRIDNF